ncbi:MAG: YcgN family cysteine cluster protein [Gammaproteobacteria bacterium]|nr:YcgN family cysteine cluster protein [Gammaproteobacteria bacterium]
MTKPDPEFWKRQSLDTLNPAQWEALCDGCAKCCLHRLENSQTNEIYYTNVCCRFLNIDECRCTDYLDRTTRAPDCVTVTLDILKDPYWLPSTCAYRLLAEGQPLPWWHPLVSGDPETVVLSGNSVSGRVINELEVENLEHYLIDWIS